jgi:titin
VFANFSSSNNLIGGLGAGNVISGNSMSGIYVFGANSAGGNNNVVQGNYIGTDATGTQALGNSIGITLDSVTNTTIGGAEVGAGNVISGNAGFGVNIFGNASRNVLAGNFIGTDVSGTQALGNRAGGVVINLRASNNRIGGTTAESRNVISANGNAGVLISDELTAGNVLQGNYIGTDVSGTQPLGNTTGVIIRQGATNTMIGGTVSSAGNLISGNQGDGIQISGGDSFGTTDNVVQGNFIGTDSTGVQALGNQKGITITGFGTDRNSIGGTATGAGNVISGNAQAGVSITQLASRNVIQGNFIGTDLSGEQALGNGTGIEILTAFGNTIGGSAPGAGNVIAFSGGDGVLIDTGTGNAILHNRIFANANLGIELLHGGNNNQAAPVLTSAVTGQGITTIQGTFSGQPSTTYTLEFFADTDNPAQGRRFLGSFTVTTNSSGVANFMFSLGLELMPGEWVTATGTDPNNNTSAFSSGVAVTGA